MIVPVICTGWIVQWYGNAPALSNLNEYDSPGARKPESKTPVSDVAVWVVWPLFVQHTVPPTGMVMFAGSKKLSPMEISVAPVGQAGGGPPRSSRLDARE